MAMNTIVIVDRAVTEPEVLLSGLKPDAVVRFLSDTRDPLGEIASFLTDFRGLAGTRGVDRLVIMAHGSPGMIELSGKRIDDDSLRSRKDALANIKAALAPGAELVLAACSVGTENDGERFIDSLGRILEVSVEASATDLGGCAGWAGLPAAAALFSKPALSAYPHSLMVAVSSNNAGFNSTNGTNLTPATPLAGTDDSLTIASSTHTTGSTADGGAGTDTLVISQTGTDLTQLTSLTNFETMNIGNNVTVTMSETQYEGFTTFNGAAGVERITLSSANGDGIIDGANAANIEVFNLNGAFTITLGSGGHNVFGSAGANQTVKSTAALDSFGAELDGGVGGSDTLVLDTGDNLTIATVSNFENLTLESGASVTMLASQMSQFTGTITAAGSETINISGNGSFTTLANVETFSVGDDGTNARTITLGAANTSVTANSSSDAVTFDVGGLTYTGTITGEGTVNDTLQLATGANISGGTVTAVENLTLGSGASVTMTTAQFNGFTGTITAAGSETVTLSGDGSFSTKSAIESYVVGDDSTNARTITITGAGHSVSATSTTDAVTFDAGGLTYTGTITGEGTVNDTLQLATGADISGGTVTAVENLTLGSGASVTMSVAQHDGFTGTVTASGTEQITFSATGGDTVTTGNAAVETYVLGTGGITFTLGTAAQNLTGSTGNDTVNVGSLTATGTLNGGTGTDTLQLGNGANISGATVSGFETLTLNGGASVTMTEAQHDAFSSVTAPGADVITISAATNGLQTATEVEKYILGAANAVTIAGAAQEITGSTGNDTFTFQGLTYTGTLSGGAGTDLIQMTTGSNISGATVTGVENLTLAGNASVTMTVSQLSTFAGGTITAGGTETVTLSGDGNFSTQSAIENYIFGDDSTNARTITITNAGHSVTATSNTDAVTFDTGTLTLTGTLTGEGTVNDTLSLGNGANISGATISGIENLTLSGTGASATMTAAQLNGFSGTVTAAGTNTITVTSTGDISSASLGALETIATAADAGTQTITLTAAQAVSHTLTASDAASDHFVITGSAGNQAVTGSAGADTIDGGAGGDSLNGGAGADLISGGDGADLIIGGGGADTLVGGAGSDTFSGTANDFNGDTISGLAAGDVITIESTDLSALNGTTLGSTIDLTAGRTLTLSGTGSNLTISASVTGGNTTLTFAVPSSGSGSGSGNGGTGPVVVSDDPSDTSSGGARTIANNGSTSGSAAIVQNTGNNGNVVTATLPSGTTLTSSGPAVAQSGGDAVNSLVLAIDGRNSSAGTDLVVGARAFLNGLANSSTLDIRTIIPTTTKSSLTEPIVLSGTASGDGSTQSEAFVIDLRNLPSGSTLQLDNIEFASILGQTTITGGAGDNYVTADDASQFISLGAEDDTLLGGGGADTIGSGFGEDILYGNQGIDFVFGGGGMDTLYGGQGADTVHGDNDNDVVYGNKGDDTLSGGQDADVLYGGQDNDIVYGNSGDDTLNGNLGNDTLYGGQGNDLISGNAGNDRLAGNNGDDTLVGGDGADTFVFGSGGGNDQVNDFQAGIDSLQFDDGQTYSSAESAGNTVLTLSGGGTVTLIGVPVSSLGLNATAGWDLI
ncbi:DUF4347 domain-containing protein [Nisaea sediminum]|uniref:DUF4347 domain-containing protein n=1 Tax=Nisaea sediminum TaxID=2775867 RepID=UPI001867C1A1|nr:DUF4347 domain-containing protein [Nisaea sediminum]